MVVMFCSSMLSELGVGWSWRNNVVINDMSWVKRLMMILMKDMVTAVVMNTVTPTSFSSFSVSSLIPVTLTLDPDSTMTPFDSRVVYISAQWQISLLIHMTGPLGPPNGQSE